MLKNGLYEQVIDDVIGKKLQEVDQHVKAASIDAIEALKVLEKYVPEIVEYGLNSVKECRGGIAEQLLDLEDKKKFLLAIDGKTKLMRLETSIS